MTKRAMLEKYITENIDSMYRFAYSYMKNNADAEDAVSESVIRALHSINSLKDTKRIKFWMYRIIANTSINMLKSTQRTIPSEFDENALGGECDKSDIGFESMVQSLDEKYKSVIVLKFFEDMTFKEIASVLGINENTVKTRLYRALEILRENPEEYL